MEQSTSPGQDVLVRVAMATDAEALAALEQGSFPSPWSVAAFSEVLSAASTLAWVAVAPDASPCGFALFQRLPGEAELLRLAVAPAYRRQHLGRRLLAHGLAVLGTTDADCCHLEVRADNHAARRLYESLGFTLSGRRRRYYRDGCDALLYRCPLPALLLAPLPGR